LNPSGHPQQSYPLLQHEPHKGEKHQTRNARAEVFVCTRLTLPPECKNPARKTRHCFNQI